MTDEPADGRGLHPRARRGRPGDQPTGPGRTDARSWSSTPAPARSSSAWSTTREPLAAEEDLPVSRGQFDPDAVARVLADLGGEPPTRSAIGSCTAAASSPARSCWTTRSGASWTSSSTWPRCTSPSRWRASTRSSQVLPGCPRWPASIPPFTPSMPAAASTYALPDGMAASAGDLRRYGFHGLSHAYATRRGQRADRARSRLRLVVCHLGSGASLAAVRGRPVGRHHDGLHPAGRPGHGHPLRHRSTRDWCCGWPSTPASPPRRTGGRPGARSGLLGLAGTADMREVCRRGPPAASRPPAGAGRVPAPAARAGRVDGGRTGRAGHAGLHRAASVSTRRISARWAANGLSFLGVGVDAGPQRQRGRRHRHHRCRCGRPCVRRRRPGGHGDRAPGERGTAAMTDLADFGRLVPREHGLVDRIRCAPDGTIQSRW